MILPCGRMCVGIWCRCVKSDGGTGRWEEAEMGGLIVGCSQCSGGQRDYVHVSAKKRYVIARLHSRYALVRNAI